MLSLFGKAFTWIVWAWGRTHELAVWLFEPAYNVLSAALARVRDAGALLLGCFLSLPPSYLWFLGVNAVLLVVGLVAPAPAALAASTLALVLLTCVFALWGENEAWRGRIAKKVEKMPSPHVRGAWGDSEHRWGPPDSEEDEPEEKKRPPAELGWIALLTMLMIALHLPPWLQASQACFDTFQVKERVNVGAWAWFLLEKNHLRSLPDRLQVFGYTVDLHPHTIEFRPGEEGRLGRSMMWGAYVLVWVTILQGVARWWQIQRDRKEAIEGVKKDPDMAVRLGERAVPDLIELWDSPALRRLDADKATRARCNIVEALGKIGDARAYPLLKKAAGDGRPEVRRAALRSLGLLANSPEMKDNRAEVLALLGSVLHNVESSEAARRGAAAGLAELDGADAAGPLLKKLEKAYRMEPPQGQDESRYTEEPNVRKDVIIAVGLHFARRRARGEEGPALARDLAQAVNHLLARDDTPSLLDDVYLRVRNATAGALARMGDREAVMPLVDRLHDDQFQNPQLVADTVTALGMLVTDLLGRPATERKDEQSALEELVRQLHESHNESVRRAAVKAVASIVSALPADSPQADGALAALVREHREALIDGHWELAALIHKEALKAAKARAPKPEGKQFKALEQQLNDDRDRYGLQASQERRAALLRVIAGREDRGLEERVAAAGRIRVARDVRGLAALQRVLGRKREHPRLNEACAWALAEVVLELRERAENEAEPDRRRIRALHELGRFGRAEDKHILLAVRDGAKSPELRKMAEKALGRLEKRLSTG